MEATKKNPKMIRESIVNWYKGRSILVTGGTGFMGKVLLEKLLRCCPGLNKIYIIVREKRGIAPIARINDLFKLPLFEKLQTTNPELKNKLVAVEGNMTVAGLGINKKFREIIQQEVSVVFHNAATLKLEAELKESVEQNLLGTKNLFDFCLGIKSLESLIHLSTAFCHCDQEVLEEKVYAPTQEPKRIMDIVEWMDEKSLQMITPSIIAPHPNTYTFTKRLSETIANEYGKQIPVAILRPSIVIPTMKDPVPGWVDSLNGPVGVLVGAGKGVIRSMLVVAENHAEIAPVDIAINCIIVAGWYRAITKHTETPVYNLSQSDFFSITWGEILERGREQFIKNPFDWPLWYPDGDIRTNVFIHNIVVFLFQIIPAYFMDFMFTIFRQKRFLVRIQKRIRLGMQLLQYFTLREWSFKTENFSNMVDHIPEHEKKIFFVKNISVDVDDYLKNCITGTRKYCLKEKPSNIPFAKRYLLFLYILDRTCKVFLIFGFLWLLIQISSKIQLIHDNYYPVVKHI